MSNVVEHGHRPRLPIVIQVLIDRGRSDLFLVGWRRIRFSDIKSEHYVPGKVNDAQCARTNTSLDVTLWVVIKNIGKV